MCAGLFRWAALSSAALRALRRGRHPPTRRCGWRSCGTGTCAVALAATLHTKGKLPATWIINPPGGRLEVSIDGHSNATLTGPAVLIRDVDISGFLLE